MNLKDKKGSVIDIIIFIVVAFVAIMFIAVWIYGFDLVSDTLTGFDDPNVLVNVSDAADRTFAQVNAAQQTWGPILAYAIIFGMILTILVSNFLVKAHPVFFVVYFLVVIGAIVVSVEVSNAYEDLLLQDPLDIALQPFGAGTFIMLNLPVWVTVIGLMGALFLFIGVIRDRGMGGAIS